VTFGEPFGERLNNMRKRKGYTQEQLAAIVGRAKSTITGYEKDNRQPDVPMIKELAKALDAIGDELLGIDANPHTKKEPALDNGQTHAITNNELDLAKRIIAIPKKTVNGYLTMFLF